MLIVLADAVSAYGNSTVRDCVARKVVKMSWRERQPLLRKLLVGDTRAKRRAERLTASCR